MPDLDGSRSTARLRRQRCRSERHGTRRGSWHLPSPRACRSSRSCRSQEKTYDTPFDRDFRQLPTTNCQIPKTADDLGSWKVGSWELIDVNPSFRETPNVTRTLWVA